MALSYGEEFVRSFISFECLRLFFIFLFKAIKITCARALTLAPQFFLTNLYACTRKTIKTYIIYLSFSLFFLFFFLVSI